MFRDTFSAEMLERLELSNLNSFFTEKQVNLSWFDSDGAKKLLADHGERAKFLQYLDTSAKNIMSRSMADFKQ